jgi:nucleotide-binding universal stress UspA family protein
MSENIDLKPESVVVGADGSPGSEAALEWATRYATARRRPLTLVTATGDPGDSVEILGHVEAARVLLERARPASEHAVGAVERLAPDLDVTVTTPLEDARQALLDLSHHASIIVLGTRGRGPVGALLLGSVSAAVASHAHCPVAVVRPVDRDSTGERGHVVVGVDGSPASTAALDFAFELASVEGRELDVVHCWSSHDTFIDPVSYGQRLDHMDAHERVLNESLAGYTEKYPDVVVKRHLPDTGPVTGLVEMSETASAVVVGSRGRTGLKSLIGSVSRSVLEHAHSTVVIVRPDHEVPAPTS